MRWFWRKETPHVTESHNTFLSAVDDKLKDMELMYSGFKRLSQAMYEQNDNLLRELKSAKTENEKLLNEIKKCREQHAV